MMVLSSLPENVRGARTLLVPFRSISSFNTIHHSAHDLDILAIKEDLLENS